MGLTPETANAQAFLPEPPSRRDSGLLAERGALDCHAMPRIQDEGGFCLIRAKAGRTPQGVEAFREDEQRLPSWRHQPLKPLHPKRPTRHRVERGGQWQGDGRPLRLRLLIRWHPCPQSFGSCLTNLPPQRDPLEVLGRAEKGRWPGAVLLKEWKSYANLPACDTETAAIVEGLMWTAIAAAALTRFLAPMTPRLVAVSRATRQVAMWARHV